MFLLTIINSIFFYIHDFSRDFSVSLDFSCVWVWVYFACLCQHFIYQYWCSRPENSPFYFHSAVYFSLSGKTHLFLGFKVLQCLDLYQLHLQFLFSEWFHGILQTSILEIKIGPIGNVCRITCMHLIFCNVHAKHYTHCGNSCDSSDIIIFHDFGRSARRFDRSTFLHINVSTIRIKFITCIIPIL